MIEVVLKYFSDFTDEQLFQLQGLERLYKEWNEKMNVISRKDINSLYLNHILHSLSIAALTDFLPETSIIDIGTGGGFPGIPLAIFFPEVRFHLVDSIGKKLKVVENVTETLHIKNVTTEHIRAEEIVNRTFDFAITRAVAPLKMLWQWSKPLIKKAGKNKLPNGLICLKGGDLAQEIFESGLNPKQIAIEEIFEEDYFKEKYILYVN